MLLLPREYRRSAARVFLASLPILYQISNVSETFNQALLIAAALWLTNCFFALCGCFFPKRLFRFCFYLWLATLVQVVYCFLKTDLFWIISLIILQPHETFHFAVRWRGLQKSLYRGIFFICLLVTMAAFREVMTNRLYVWFFAMPAGSFFLLTIIAFVWQNQPGFTEEKATVKKEVSL